MLKLIVEDEFGEIGEDSINFQTEVGPKVSQLKVEGDGEQVRLSWNWDGPVATFEIFRNGDSLSIISEYGFTDTPLLSGSTDYTVKPIIDDRTINSGANTVEGFIVDSVDPKSSDVSVTELSEVSDVDSVSAPQAMTRPKSVKMKTNFMQSLQWLSKRSMLTVT